MSFYLITLCVYSHENNFMHKIKADYDVHVLLKVTLLYVICIYVCM